MNMLKDLRFDTDPNKFKYQQIVDCFIDNISKGNIKKNQTLPSINVFSKEYKVSRDTVEKAYKVLKRKNIIAANKGKTTYVNSTEISLKKNVLYLMNKMNDYKSKVYNSFVDELGDEFNIDIEIYHCDESHFLKLLEKNIGHYDYYVIMPHFKSNYAKEYSFSNEALEIIKKIPRNQLVVLDNNDLSVDGDIIEIYQDFENDVYNALLQGKDKIINHEKMIVRIPESEQFSYQHKISRGCKKFCLEHNMDYEVLSIDHLNLQKGELQFVIDDDDLVNVIDVINDNKLKLGKEIGVLSYNETPLKRLLGIAVISTDFKKMGKTAANMLTNGENGKIKNPFRFIDRKSI
ncbi:GntR family transcriptional regulator [Wenyingzhuangia sp. chi5]|uniref:GntR family transcriptional regulator n=1 Tax=Wenyingzhuangia gilva TaxID=3057677 RepID=A0ABT8VT86_9FLAO|nr:GntR family transcriptional regulator [Wenyingzhuangia sp. chi5]MDO3695169.1 GntR family transcriptional regulator [Wenyingzhuangia sp. chi5]